MKIDELIKQYQQPAQQPVQATVNDQSAHGMSGFSQGVAKGELTTLRNLGRFGQEILQQTAGRGIAAILGKPQSSIQGIGSALYQNDTATGKKAEQFLTPNTTAEKVGFGTERIAEFLLPAGKLGALEKGASITQRMAIEGVFSGSLTALQNGKIDKRAYTAAMISAAFPLVTALGKEAIKASGFGKSLQRTGSKIESTALRPLKSELDDIYAPRGTSPTEIVSERLNKYKLGGDVRTIYTKVTQRLSDNADELQRLSNSIDESVDLNRVMRETEEALYGSGYKSFGNNRSIERVLNGLDDEIKYVAGNNGKVDFAQAMDVKRAAGERGAWRFGSADPDANAVEEVYTAFYKALRKETERIAAKTGNARLIDLNRESTELIPLAKMALRRLPIEERSSLLGLTDTIGLVGSVFDPRSIAIVAASRAARSGSVGAGLYSTGTKIQSMVPSYWSGGRTYGPVIGSTLGQSLGGTPEQTAQ